MIKNMSDLLKKEPLVAKLLADFKTTMPTAGSAEVKHLMSILRLMPYSDLELLVSQLKSEAKNETLG